MKKLIMMITALGLFCSQAIQAEVLVVTNWKATPGNLPTMLESAAKYKPLHEKLGADVRILQSANGTMVYSTRFDNWAAWAEFNAKSAKDAKVQKLVAATQSGGWSEYLGMVMLDIISPSEKIGTVFETYVWQPVQGRLPDLIENGLKAQAIHKKDGVHVAVGVNSMNQMVYLTSYDDLAHYAKNRDAGPSEEFQKFFAEAGQDPTGTLVNVLFAQEL